MYHQSLKVWGKERSLEQAVACGCPGASYVVSGLGVHGGIARDHYADVTYMFEDNDTEIQDVVDLVEIENWGCDVVAVSKRKEM